MNGGFLTVSQLTGYIKNLLEADDVLGMISVSGEISNISSLSFIYSINSFK